MGSEMCIRDRSKPERWTQGWFARDENMVEVTSRSTTARCWCAAGAITKVAQRESYDEALYYLVQAVGGGMISTFNDSSLHNQVLAAFDRAIELAKKENN